MDFPPLLSLVFALAGIIAGWLAAQKQHGARLDRLEHDVQEIGRKVDVILRRKWHPPLENMN